MKVKKNFLIFTGSFTSHCTIQDVDKEYSMLSNPHDLNFQSKNDQIKEIKEIPYEKLITGSKLIKDKKGPNGFTVISKILENGVSIIGEYNDENQEFEGLVKYEDPNEDIEYLANVKNSKKNGFGVFKFGNGDLYVGNFKNDMMDGEGVYYSADGPVLKGNSFSEEGFTGIGEYYWTHSEEGYGKYIGEIRNGIVEGEGKKYFFFEFLKNFLTENFEKKFTLK